MRNYIYLCCDLLLYLRNLYQNNNEYNDSKKYQLQEEVIEDEGIRHSH